MDKIDLLLDAIEHPDRYADKEIEAMLADPEIREVYSLLYKTGVSLKPNATLDVDAEWEMFKTNHPDVHQPKKFRLLNLLTRNIAASIAIGIASIVAVAAVVGISVNHAFNHKGKSTTPAVAKVESAVVGSTDTIMSVSDTTAVAPGIIVFDNEPLETIANRIAEYYGCKVEFSADAPKTLRLYFRWNQSQTLDEVAESLNNFEQIHLSVKNKTIKID